MVDVTFGDPNRRVCHDYWLDWMGGLWKVGCLAGWFEMDLRSGVEMGVVLGITVGSAAIDGECGRKDVELVGLSVVVVG